MKNITDVLNKFNNEVFIEAKGNSVTSQNGWKVSYTTEFSNNIQDIKRLPVQIVVHISKNGTHVQTWGCDSNDEHSCFVEWFVRNYAKAFKNSIDLNRIQEKTYKNEFENL